MCRPARVVIRESRTDIGGQPHVVAGRISLASQDVHDSSLVHASFAGTMSDSDVWRVRLRPSGYGATAFAWLAEPKLTLRQSRALAKAGAEGGTRTPTVLLPPAPQAGEFGRLEWIDADPLNGS